MPAFVVGALDALEIGVDPVEQARGGVDGERAGVHEFAVGDGGDGAGGGKAGAPHCGRLGTPRSPEQQAGGGIEREAAQAAEAGVQQQTVVQQRGVAQRHQLARLIRQIPVARHPVHGQMVHGCNTSHLF